MTRLLIATTLPENPVFYESVTVNNSGMKREKKRLKKVIKMHQHLFLAARREKTKKRRLMMAPIFCCGLWHRNADRH
jgi:hypothetical protein